MRKIVLDTNCLLMSLPRICPYRKIWDDFLKGKLALCVTNEIIEEYLEIIEQKTNANIASNVVSVILSQKNVEFVTPYYKLHLIHFGMLTTLSLELSNESFFSMISCVKCPKVWTLDIIVYE